MNPKTIGIGILVLAIIGIAVYQFNGTGTNQESADSTMEVSQNTATSNMVGSDESAMQESQYTDGTYEATGNYTSPAQQEEVDIVITLENGAVTDAQFTGKATNPTSMKMQGLFSEGFQEEVIGKRIDDINLTVVNGSSLTPKGFMDALQKIKEESSA
ncbi:MAG TPA: hypothetical protein PLS49_05630 [Candidatus Woesebacteria bacterium]|nr:hypothetical protein [Candidatus Woesebacteria bacterium]